MLFQVRSRRIKLADPLVGELLGEFGVQARSHGQDVRDIRPGQNILVIGSDVVTDEHPFNHFIERFDPVLELLALRVHHHSLNKNY